jgi:predicted alpha/beta-hydrolase family hydrolase
MARTLRISWATGEKVTARLAMPQRPGRTGVLLAHGAGVGQDHPWMVEMRDLLAGSGLPTMTFNYAYTEAGRKSPDRPPKLLAVHRAAAERLATYVDDVVVAGKSMGGRIGSHLVGDEGWPAAALVYLGYPLVPMGKGEPRPTDHLDRIDVPQYFVCGTRDRLSPPQLIEPLSQRVQKGSLLVVADGDHSLRVLKRTGRTNHEVIADVASAVTAWILDV